MSVENWKLEKDLCRCCLSEGTFQNLAEPVTNQGAEEIYSDMLIEGLDVNLTPVSGPLCTSTYTICEECILRLRDACSFKRQVLLSEKRFRELYSKDIIQCHSSVKKEAPDSDNEEGPVKQEMIEDDDDFRQYDDDDGDLKCEVEEEIQEVKKAKTKKPKAKEKTKPKKRLGRPRKAPGGPEAEPEAEPDGDPAGTNDNKGLLEETETQPADYSPTADGGKHKYVCNKCGTGYKSVSWVSKHLKDIHQVTEVRHPTTKQSFICDICKIKSFDRESMILHMRTHKPEEVHVSASRESTSKTKQSKNGYSKCKMCQKMVHSKIMRIHLQAHGFFSCRKCGIQCADSKELLLHEQALHGITEGDARTFVCDHCGLVIKSRMRDKIKHMRQHGLYQCATCYIVFLNKQDLDAHNRVAHEVKMYPCGACDYKADKPQVLLDHQRRVHMNEKNVPCPLCKATFYNKHSLADHMVRHNPVKKYECSYCQKKFPRLGTKKRHEMIHTGEKNKVCKVCDARFVQKASLNYHMKKYHPEAV